MAQSYNWQLAAEVGGEMHTFTFAGGFYTLAELHRIQNIYAALPDTEKVRRKYGDLARVEDHVLAQALTPARYQELQREREKAGLSFFKSLGRPAVFIPGPNGGEVWYGKSPDHYDADRVDHGHQDEPPQ